MVTAVLIDESPVAFVGADRWYPTVAMLALNAAERAEVAALCEALIGAKTAKTAQRARDPSR